MHSVHVMPKQVPMLWCHVFYCLARRINVYKRFYIFYENAFLTFFFTNLAVVQWMLCCVSVCGIEQVCAVLAGCYGWFKDPLYP